MLIALLDRVFRNTRVNSNLSTNYWKVSRELPLGLLFIMPLWVVYEYFAFSQNAGLGGQQRTGIDYLVTSYLYSYQIPLEFSIILPAFLVVLYLFKKSSRECFTQIKLIYFARMFIESIVYAAILGLAIGHFVRLFFLSAGSLFDTEKISILIVNLGAGLYEELVFRLILISLILFVFKSYGTKISYLVSILISSFAFTLFHFLPVVDIEPDAVYAGGRYVINPAFFKQHIRKIIEVGIVAKKHDGFDFIIQVFHQLEQIPCT